MAAFSLLLEAFQQQQPQQGVPGPRTSARPTALRGFARGSLGSQGSRTLQRRNVDAGYQKELEQMQSPIFRAFLGQLHPGTPITDYLRRG